MKNNKEMAFAALFVTAVLMVGCLGFIASSPSELEFDNDALGANETATINMFIGDSFSYTPATNLPSTIAASGNGLVANGGFLTFTGGVLSGTATVAGTYVVALEATWTSGSLTQRATQTITFNVFAHIVVTSASSASGLAGQPFGGYQLTFTGPSDVVTTLTAPSGTTWNGLNFSAVTRWISGMPVAAGSQTFTWNLSSASSGESINFSVTVTIYDGIAITSSASSEGYVGGAYSFTVTTSEPSATIAATDFPYTIGISWTAPTMSGTFNTTAAPSVSPYYQDYTIEYLVHATIAGNYTSAMQYHTLRVWASLEFKTLPTISNVTTGISGSMATLSADILGATSIVIDWGDGTFTPVTPGLDATALLASHDYAEEGTYLGSIEATNGEGTVKSFFMLDIGIGSGDDDDEKDKNAALSFSVAVFFVCFMLFLILGFLIGRGMWQFAAIEGIITLIAVVALFLGAIL